jgi:hypothetical protein
MGPAHRPGQPVIPARDLGLQLLTIIDITRV